jgi:hypothetical protein
MEYSKRHGFVEDNKDFDGIVDYISNLFNYVIPVHPLPHYSYPIKESKRTLVIVHAPNNRVAFLFQVKHQPFSTL